jgi:hypothetical protein
LVWLHHKLPDEFPAEFAALVDKGFTHCVGAYLHLPHAYYPAFVHDGEIGVQGVKDSKKQSADRYVVEVFYSRVKRWLMLRDRARWANIHMLDDAWCIGWLAPTTIGSYALPTTRPQFKPPCETSRLRSTSQRRQSGLPGRKTLRCRRICSAQPICELLINDRPPSPTPKRQSLAVYVCVSESTGVPMPPVERKHWRTLLVQ